MLVDVMVSGAEEMTEHSSSLAVDREHSFGKLMRYGQFRTIQGISRRGFVSREHQFKAHETLQQWLVILHHVVPSSKSRKV